MFGKKFLAALLIGGNLFCASLVQAEVKTYEGVGEYVMGERDTLETAKQGAKDRALRNALEKAGVLIQSRSRSEDLELVEDTITSQTGAVLKVLEVTYEREDFLVKARVLVDIDADDLNRRLEAYANTTPDDRIALANKKIDEAMNCWYEEKDSEAIALLGEAITLNPNDAEIYVKRATIFMSMGEAASCAYDADKALQLNPNHAMAYFLRGAANLTLSKNAQAIADLNEAIRLDDKNKHAYYFRGLYYRNIGDKERARTDFLKAKELGYYPAAAKKFLEENG